MSFQWSQQAPAFEFPTCYRTENRFLTLRAAVLIVLALAIVWVALAGPDPKAGAISLTKVERGASEPHVLLALLIMILGAIDLWVASRQRKLLLAPGQPGSITGELVRMSKGVSSGAPWLKQVLSTGMVAVPHLRHAYRRALQALAPQVAEAPVSLHDYLSLRIAHFAFAAGLLLILGLTAAVSQSPTLSLAALLYSALATALLARSAWIAKAAPSPTALAVALATTLLLGLLIALLAGGVPAIGRLARLGLPVATALLLLCLMLIEGLAMLAARVKADALPQGKAASGRVKAELVADPERLLAEVERELHRYWSEGVPNRRFAWQTSPSGGKGDDGRFLVSVLEESQPILPAEQRDGVTPPPKERKLWLLALGALGLLLTAIGGLLWIRLAHAHVQDAAASWMTAAPALVLMLAGGYACRLGHLLWSRIEVDSTLLSVECRSAEQATDPSGMHRPGPAGASQTLQVRMSVVRARSVFYAAGEHRVGSRTLLRLSGDEAAAQRSIDQLRAYTERSATPAGAERAPGLAPAAARAAAAFPPPAAAPAKFCPACGTPVLQGARFCQNCGASLRPS